MVSVAFAQGSFNLQDFYIVANGSLKFMLQLNKISDIFLLQVYVLNPKQDLHGLGFDPYKHAPEFRGMYLKVYQVSAYFMIAAMQLYFKCSFLF